MDKRTIKILGRDIAYLDNESGELGTVLFIHGNSFSSETFEEQFQSPIFDGYRLLALDLYGHGDSAKLLNPFGYHLPHYAELIIEFLKELNLSQVVLAGHSLGGHIALEVIAQKNKKLISGVFVWGTPPISKNPELADMFHSIPTGAYLYQAELSKSEISHFVADCFGKEEGSDKYIKIVEESRGEARSSLGTSVGQANFADEILAIENAQFEVAVIYATEDRFVKSQYFFEFELNNLWKQKCHPVEGSHFCHIDNSEEFNQLLMDYIQDLDSLFFADDRKDIIENNISTFPHLI